MPILPAPSKTFILISTLFSGLCWYFSFSLSGEFWYLMWIAPIPVLYVSFLVNARHAFSISFIAYLIGRLSWLPYLLSVVPAFIAVMFTVLLPLIFAVIVIAARKIVTRYSHWSAAFAVPVLFTSFEYIMFLFSKDGTIGSVAYTQCNFLPVVQVASVTGIEGITFLLTFIPSAIVIIILHYRNKKSIKPLSFITAGIACTVFLFGSFRLVDDPADKQMAVNIGMAAIEERAYKNDYEPVSVNEIYIAERYLKDVSTLADQGAQVIVLPEKSLIVNDSTNAVILQMFTDTAIARHVFIVIGVTKIKKGYYENNAWLISNEGKLLTDYQKVNLFEGEAADGFKPGNSIGLLNREGTTEGVAICKDMDFQRFILGYGKANVAMLYVPAWDFVRDGWLHCRIAMMRSVEGGYPMVRNAREGRLTISDYRGKVLFEASSESRTETQLLGKVQPGYHTTIYSRFGDWFSILNLMAVVLFIFLMVRKPLP